MDHTALYEEDVFAWSRQQAGVLRRLAASGLALPNGLDLEHVAEEIEDVGISESNHVRSNLEEAMVHLIKVASSPSADPVPHWLGEVDTLRSRARKHFANSMRRRLDLEALWRGARRDAAAALARYGETAVPLPDACPYAADDLLDEAASAEALVARLPPPAP